MVDASAEGSERLFYSSTNYHPLAIMSCNASEVGQDSVSLLLSQDDFLNFSETTEDLQKNLEALREIIQCRTNILMQKKQKRKQILDSQELKLDNERKEYIKQSEAVMNKLKEAKSKLMDIEHSYFSVREKLNAEKETHRMLEEKIKQLQLEIKQKDAKLCKTLELFTTVLSWYKDYLNMVISLDNENPKIMTVTFKETKKDFKGYPYVRLEMLDGDRFQVLKMHPSVEENNDIMNQIIQSYEIVLFLHKFRKHFLGSS